MMETETVRHDTLRWWHVGLVLLAALLVRLAFFVGMTGSDDLQYARKAQQVSQGSFYPDHDLAALRFGLIVPTALAYRLFGISAVSTAWFTMTCSLLGVLAAVLLGRELFGPRAGLWAGVLYAVLPLDVVEAGILLPDLCVAALTALAFLCVLRGERAATVPTKAPLFILAGVLLGAGYLCKMTALMTTVILVVYLLIRRRNAAWLAPMLAGLGAVLLAEAVFYRIARGEFFFRFHVVGGWNHALADGKLAGPLASLWEYPRAMFLSIEEFGPFWYLLIVAGIWAIVARVRRAWVVALWVVPLWLALEFGISSFTQRTFPAHVPRYLTVMTIPAAALIGAMFARLAERRWRVVLALIAAATLASSLFFAGLHASLVESTVWNLRLTASRLKELPARPTYVLFGRSTLDWLSGPDRLDLRELYLRHDPVTGVDSEPRPLGDLDGSYVVVDRRLIRFRQERQEVVLSDYLLNVPADWRKVIEVRNDFSGLRYLPIRLVKCAVDKRILPRPVAARFTRTLGSVMNDNECVVYEVPGPETSRTEPGKP